MKKKELLQELVIKLAELKSIEDEIDGTIGQLEDKGVEDLGDIQDVARRGYHHVRMKAKVKLRDMGVDANSMQQHHVDTIGYRIEELTVKHVKFYHEIVNDENSLFHNDPLGYALLDLHNQKYIYECAIKAVRAHVAKGIQQ